MGQLWDRGIILKAIFFELCPFLTFCQNCLLTLLIWKLANISTWNIAYLLIITRNNCKAMDIILNAIFLELCLFLNLAIFVKSIIYFKVAHYSKSNQSSSGPLTRLFKLLPQGQYWPCPWGHLYYTVLYWKTLKNLTVRNY